MVYTKQKILYLFLFLYFINYSLEAESPLDAPQSRSDSNSILEIESADQAKLIRGLENKDASFYLEGRVRLRLGKGTLFADKVILDGKNQELFAEGNLRFQESEKTLIRSERLIYSFKLQQGIFYNANGFQKPIHFIGKDIRLLDKKAISLRHFRFTSNSTKPPHYHFSAKKIIFYSDGTILATGVWYYIGGVPILPLPILYTTNWGTGLVTQLGRGNIQGNFIQNTYHIYQDHSSLWPSSYTFLFDVYQNIGDHVGLELANKSKYLDYEIAIGLARFHRYTLENGEVTNLVEICEGEGNRRTCSEGKKNYNWEKINALVHLKDNNIEEQRTRNIYLEYENYTNYLYEYEFGSRREPETTLESLYQRKIENDSLLDTSLDWKFIYEETWATWYWKVAGERKKVWRQRENFQDSTYETARDIAPSLALNKEIYLVTLPYFETPLLWNHSIDYQVQKDYSEKEVFHTRTESEYKSDFLFFLPIASYFNWDIRLGYGNLQTKLDLDSEDEVQKASIRYEEERSTYQYLFSENIFSIGESTLFLDISHRYKDPFAIQRKDIPKISNTDFSKNQNLNEIGFDIYYFPLPDIFFSLYTIYDARPFPVEVENASRWHYPVFHSDIYLDWRNLFQNSRQNLSSRNKVSFFGTHITNDHFYDPMTQKSHINILGLYLEVGGYDLPWIKRLRYLSLGFEWYHTYFNTALDHLRYTMQSDFQLSKWIYLETILESRASNPSRYRNGSLDENGNDDHVNFSEDVFNSSGLAGGGKQKQAIFNLVYFRSGLIFDLGDWEFRLAYEIEQRYIPETSNNSESSIYYERRIYFGLNLIRFDLGGYGSKPSRFQVSKSRH